MANINTPDIQFYQSFAREMLGKLQRVSYLTNHGPSNGSYHENILKSVLKNFLSKRFSVKTGFIFGEEYVSSQIDILIIDENEPMAYIFQEGDFAVVIPRAVVAAIEVKTNLTSKANFDEVIYKISKIKGMCPSQHHISSFLFSFDGGVKTNSSLSNWLKSKTCLNLVDKKNLAPDSIIFFTKEIMLLPYSEKPNFSPSSGKYKKIIRNSDVCDLNASHLSIFLALIVNACIGKNVRDTRTFATVQADNLVEAEQVKESEEVFHFGEGMIIQ